MNKGRRHLLVPPTSTLLSQAARCPPIPSRVPLFLTKSLTVGGAQRSLLNLLLVLADATTLHLGVCGHELPQQHSEVINHHNVELHDLTTALATGQIVEEVLMIVRQHKINTILFWNLQAQLKWLLVSNPSFPSDFRFIDVSPGPACLRGLRSLEKSNHHLGMTVRRYVEQLHAFVQKYRATDLTDYLPDLAYKVKTIRNGVPKYCATSDRSYPAQILGAEHNRNLAVVSMCRFVPEKLLLQKLSVAYELKKRMPSFTLSIFTPLCDIRNNSYAQQVYTLHRKLQLQDTVFFYDYSGRPSATFSNFRVFLMLSYDQGCPNSSLEAFSASLPVVANSDGGTSEQVKDGFNGFLVDEKNIAQIADRVEYLLRNPIQAREMGRRGAQLVGQQFNMEQMIYAYCRLILN